MAIGIDVKDFWKEFLVEKVVNPLTGNDYEKLSDVPQEVKATIIFKKNENEKGLGVYHNNKYVGVIHQFHPSDLGNIWTYIPN